MPKYGSEEDDASIGTSLHEAVINVSKSQEDKGSLDSDSDEALSAALKRAGLTHDRSGHEAARLASIANVTPASKYPTLKSVV